MKNAYAFGYVNEGTVAEEEGRKQGREGRKKEGRKEWREEQKEIKMERGLI